MSLADALDVVEEELDLDPIGIDCDGGCGKKLTRHDDRHSKRVGECNMFMLLCPECAEEAGWIDE